MFCVASSELFNKTVSYAHEIASSWANVSLPDRTLRHALPMRLYRPYFYFNLVDFTSEINFDFIYQKRIRCDAGREILSFTVVQEDRLP